MENEEIIIFILNDYNIEGVIILMRMEHGVGTLGWILAGSGYNAQIQTVIGRDNGRE
jgi:hypothetical protein